jgi:hypothetical protein
VGAPDDLPPSTAERDAAEPLIGDLVYLCSGAVSARVDEPEQDLQFLDAVVGEVGAGLRSDLTSS